MSHSHLVSSYALSKKRPKDAKVQMRHNICPIAFSSLEDRFETVCLEYRKILKSCTVICSKSCIS